MMYGLLSSFSWTIRAIGHKGKDTHLGGTAWVKLDCKLLVDGLSISARCLESDSFDVVLAAAKPSSITATVKRVPKIACEGRVLRAARPVGVEDKS